MNTSPQTNENDQSLTVEQASELVGDDIAFWLANPFMTPDMLAEKAAWWISRARANSPGKNLKGDHLKGGA